MTNFIMTTKHGTIDLLNVFGFEERMRPKLVRHQHTRYDIPTLIREGWFDFYQTLQARPVFNSCEQ